MPQSGKTQPAGRTARRVRLVRLSLISLLVIGALLMISVLLPFDWVLQAYLWYKDGLIERDTDNNGIVDYLETWRDGVLISSQWDTDGDGRFDTFAAYQDERVVIFEIDFNRDGRIDYREYHDEQGVARYQIDRDYDGVFEESDIGKGPGVTAPGGDPGGDQGARAQ